MADRKRPRWVYAHRRGWPVGVWMLWAPGWAAYAIIEHMDGGMYRFSVQHFEPIEIHDTERDVRMYCPRYTEIAHGEPIRDPRKARRDGKACLDRWMDRPPMDRCRHVNALWMDANDKAMRACVEHDDDGLPVPPWAWAAKASNPHFRDEMAPDPACIGWRLGGEGESYRDGFIRVWTDLQATERQRVLDKYPPPERWKGKYNAAD